MSRYMNISFVLIFIHVYHVSSPPCPSWCNLHSEMLIYSAFRSITTREFLICSA
uniref:Uncharacterized protein n=1 Tax=Arundo donax TaxID=35708 RepID=A0A0A9FVC6_ARUDO